MIDVSTIKVSEFKSCHLEPPTREGHYLVIRFYRGSLSYASELYYVPGFGWNISREIVTGRINTEHNITFDNAFPSFWAEVTAEEISDGDK